MGYLGISCQSYVDIIFTCIKGTSLKILHEEYILSELGSILFPKRKQITKYKKSGVVGKG